MFEAKSTPSFSNFTPEILATVGPSGTEKKELLQK